MFYNSLPSIDLHGENKDSARVLIEEFIRDNIKLRNNKLIIIHGIGTGILKNEVHSVLKKNKNVISYKIDFFNPGCTIVEIKTII